MNKSIVIGKIIQLDAIKPFNPLFLLDVYKRQARRCVEKNGCVGCVFK